MAGRLPELADRLVASDPGLVRLRMALSSGLAMSSALGVEFVFAHFTHASTQATVISMLLGAVVAMMGTMALNGTKVWPMVRTAVFFPVAIGVGMLAGVAVGTNTDLMLVVFVLVMFVAVMVRRFGRPFFFYGFMTWMGYFFASFTHATLAALPGMLLAVVIAAAWVLLLGATVLRTNPQRTLRRTLQAFTARGRSVARAAAELLDEGTDIGPDAAVDSRGRYLSESARDTHRLLRRLHTCQIQLGEAALMIDGWLGDEKALPSGWSAPALRRRLLDVQLAIDTIAGSAEALVAPPVRFAAAAAMRGGPDRPTPAPRTDRDLRRRAGEAVRLLARRDDVHAQRAAAELARRANGADIAGSLPARHLADAVLELLSLARQWDSPPTVEPLADGVEFEPALTLALGNLPGSMSAARDVSARGSVWKALAHLNLVTRQALQVALAGGLAIVAGRLLSQQRYYWAVIAAFVMFTGTATRAEAVIKGFNRVLGTMLGLVVGIALADLTAGHTGWVLVVVVLSMTCGFYLVRISYAFMIFFVTIMVSQLYSVLHEFSAGLLVLRLEETAIGAGVAMLVALLFLPLSTRDTAAAARANMFTALAELLDTAATRMGDPEPEPADQNAEDERDGGDDADDGTNGSRLGKRIRAWLADRRRRPDDERDDAETADADGEQEAEQPKDLDGLMRTLDHRRQQLALVARPLTRPVIGTGNPRLINHRLTRFTALTTYSRALLAGMRQAVTPPPTHLAAACRALADAATALADTTSGRATPEVEAALGRATELLFGDAPADPSTRRHPVARPLLHVEQLLVELAAAAGAVDAAKRLQQPTGSASASARK